jgi:beta-lactamase class D
MNFTEEHLRQLKELVFLAVVKNYIIVGKLGQQFTVGDLMMSSLVTLRNLRKHLQQVISNFTEDEWEEKSLVTQDQETYCKNSYNLVNLMLGYRINEAKIQEKEAQKAELQERINAIKESTKTPEEKLQELERELDSL